MPVHFLNFHRGVERLLEMGGGEHVPLRSGDKDTAVKVEAFTKDTK